MGLPRRTSSVAAEAPAGHGVFDLSEQVRSRARVAGDRRIARRFCAGVVASLFLSLAWAAVKHEFRILRTSVVGEPYPMSVYGLMATPGTSPAPGAPGAAGADFSQVYTSGLALRHGESAYRPTSPQYADRFGRLSGYPPLMNWVYLPLSLLPYADALLAHTLLSLLALLGVTFFVLWELRLRHQILPVSMVQLACYLLTPIGFTHLERGQFDLFVAAGMAASVGCLHLPGRRLGLAAAAGVVGALKWTAVSFLGCFSVLGFLLSARNKRWTFVVIPTVMALGTGLFWRAVEEYWATIRFYEIDTTAYGLTFQHFLPRLATKLAPVIATLALSLAVVLSVPRARRPIVLARVAAPFALALANMAVCFGTLSYEYHTVSLLGMIPGLTAWIEREAVSPRIKALVAAVFGGFLLVAFRAFGLTVVSFVTMTAIYGVVALFFLGVCGYIVGTWTGAAGSTAAASR